MKNIVFSRVDDRLIHGEVVAEWLPLVSANNIIVIDDIIAKDIFTKRLIQLLSPKGTIANVCSIKQAADFLKQPSNQNEKIMLLAKSPTTFLNLVNHGININRINIGGMGLMGNRKIIYKNIACSNEEIDSINQLLSKQIDVFYQLVPSQPATNFTKIFSSKKF